MPENAIRLRRLAPFERCHGQCRQRAPLSVRLPGKPSGIQAVIHTLPSDKGAGKTYIERLHTREALLPRRVGRYDLSPSEKVALESMIRDVFAGARALPVTTALQLAALNARFLPKGLLASLLEFRNEDKPDIFIVGGMDLTRFDIDPTPIAIQRFSAEPAFPYDFPHLCFASILGEIFTFATIQNGNIINDVIPIPSNSNKAMSSGFFSDFGLHTEDAFSPYSGEYLGLFCIRNPDKVPTIVSSVRDLSLSDKHKRLLFSKSFSVSANIAHELINAQSRLLSILFGAYDDPYIRINTNYPAIPPDAGETFSAYSELVRQLEASIFDVSLQPGECMYINNRLVAHGRRSYMPVFNGSSRWLRRLYITTDLKRSRHLRASSSARVIEAH